MSGGAATYWGNAMLDLLGPGFTPPANIYFGLYTTAPTDTTSGTEMDSVTEPGYARVGLVNNVGNFPAASGAAKTVGANVVFPANSGAGPWAAAVAWGLFDASIGGNRIIWGLMASLACPVGQQITIPSGSTLATVA